MYVSMFFLIKTVWYSILGKIQIVSAFWTQKSERELHVTGKVLARVLYQHTSYGNRKLWDVDIRRKPLDIHVYRLNTVGEYPWDILVSEKFWYLKAKKIT